MNECEHLNIYILGYHYESMKGTCPITNGLILVMKLLILSNKLVWLIISKYMIKFNK